MTRANSSTRMCGILLAAVIAAVLWTPGLAGQTPDGPSVQAPSAARASAGMSAAEDEQAQALVGRMCNQCHDSTPIFERRRTRAEWQDVLSTMRDHGAEGDDREFDAVLAYLLRRQGVVRINSAASDEIAAALGLPKADADAVVAYRAANGPFGDFEALKRVPQVDGKLLDAHRAAVMF